MSSVEEIWQASLGGLMKGLAEAKELEKKGDWLSAAIKRASVLYSYRVPGWRRWARVAAEIAESQGLDVFSHGQCDVVGTLLIGTDDARAKTFLLAGLRKDPPPHSKALLNTGLAEIACNKGESSECLRRLLTALSFEQEALREPDRVQAARQFGRVLRRAMVLYARMGDPKSARLCAERAHRYAHDAIWGSRSQRWKLWFARTSWGL